MIEIVFNRSKMPLKSPKFPKIIFSWEKYEKVMNSSMISMKNCKKKTWNTLKKIAKTSAWPIFDPILSAVTSPFLKKKFCILPKLRHFTCQNLEERKAYFCVEKMRWCQWFWASEKGQVFGISINSSTNLLKFCLWSKSRSQTQKFM